MSSQDRRRSIVMNYVREMVSKRFDMIPSVLFAKQMSNDVDTEEILQLVASSRRSCPCCDEEVEHAGQLSCECDEGDCHCDENKEHEWACDSCGKDSILTDIPYEDLPLSGPRYGGWPAAHGLVYWTTEPDIVAAASDAGFLVYEPQEFAGHILAIDGGGYDFYDAHWLPLYHALGLKWHEQDEEWKELS